MKEFILDCLPKQLFDWVRRYHQLPAQIHIGVHEAAELTFSALFPNIQYRSVGEECRELGCSHCEGRSVWVQPMWRRAGGESLGILRVHITDMDNGIGSVLPIIKDSGLLDGEEHIREAEDVMNDVLDKKHRAEQSKILTVFGVLFVLILFGVAVV